MRKPARRVAALVAPLAALCLLQPALVEAKHVTKKCQVHCATKHKPKHHTATTHTPAAAPTIAPAPAQVGIGGAGTLPPTMLPPIDPRLVEAFVAAPNPVTAGQPAAFDASATHDADGAITLWGWDFGDGAGGGGVTTTHVFSQAGVYRVTLIVGDSVGHVQSMTEPVVVTPALP